MINSEKNIDNYLQRNLDLKPIIIVELLLVLLVLSKY